MVKSLIFGDLDCFDRIQKDGPHPLHLPDDQSCVGSGNLRPSAEELNEGDRTELPSYLRPRVAPIVAANRSACRCSDFEAQLFELLTETTKLIEASDYRSA